MMKIVESPHEAQRLVEEWRCQNQSIGFVPTMGALHEGHLALARRARAENEKFVTSIFVNPTQFRPGEDLAKYPRPFERDCELLENVGCDLLFAPAPEAMYGDNGESQTFVEAEELSARWEGAARHGHFRGVATVVAKLFNIMRPHRTYFGEKDFQQLQIIKRMVRDLNFAVEVVSCATVRENDGLALSSRNAYLSEDERAAAPALYRALVTGQKMIANGARDANRVVEKMRLALADEPILQLEYLAIVDSDSLKPMAEFSHEKPARAIVAARAGSTRLIDNIALNPR